MQVIDASNRPNDRHGYSAYCLVLMAPEPIRSRIHEFRDSVRPMRAMIGAHVTALGTFCEIESLDAVNERISAAIGRTEPLGLSATGEVLELGDHTSAIAKIDVTPEMQLLHDRLAEEILPIAVNAYGDPGSYMAHLTFYQEIPMAEVERAGQRAHAFEIDDFVVPNLTLMGRVGTAANGIWREIREFPLGS
jgi:hypothetical protein